MPKFRFKLKIEIKTVDLIVSAPDRSELAEILDLIPLEEIVRSHSDTLNVAFFGEIERVMESRPVSITIPDPASQLTSGEDPGTTQTKDHE